MGSDSYKFIPHSLMTVMQWIHEYVPLVARCRVHYDKYFQIFSYFQLI